MTAPPPRSAAAPGKPTLWPSMGNPPADAIRSLLFQFNETQWWPQARLRGAQFVQATALLRHASAASPAWRERLAGITLHPHRPIDEAAWCSLPVPGSQWAP